MTVILPNIFYQKRRKCVIYVTFATRNRSMWDLKWSHCQMVKFCSIWTCFWFIDWFKNWLTVQIFISIFDRCVRSSCFILSWNLELINRKHLTIVEFLFYIRSVFLMIQNCEKISVNTFSFRLCVFVYLIVIDWSSCCKVIVLIFFNKNRLNNLFSRCNVDKI